MPADQARPLVRLSPSLQQGGRSVPRKGSLDVIFDSATGAMIASAAEASAEHIEERKSQPQ